MNAPFRCGGLRIEACRRIRVIDCAGYLAATGMGTSDDSSTISPVIIHMFSTNAKPFHAQATMKHRLYQRVGLWSASIFTTGVNARDDERNLARGRARR